MHCAEAETAPRPAGLLASPHWTVEETEAQEGEVTPATRQKESDGAQTWRPGGLPPTPLRAWGRDEVAHTGPLTKPACQRPGQRGLGLPNSSGLHCCLVRPHQSPKAPGRPSRPASRGPGYLTAGIPRALFIPKQYRKEGCSGQQMQIPKRRRLDQEMEPGRGRGQN